MSNDAITKIKDLLPNGLFSYLTITCGNEKWKVHKNILWIQSEYFRKLLSGNFKEANATTLDLSFDDPNILAALIHYCYTFTLRESVHSATSPTNSYFVHIYAIADKYDIPNLLNLAVERLQKIYNPTTRIVDHADFIDTIRAVNEHTADRIEDGGGLWAIVLPTVQANMAGLLRNEAFKELLLDLPELNFHLLSLLSSAETSITPVSEMPRDRVEVDVPRRGTFRGVRGRGR